MSSYIYITHSTIFIFCYFLLQPTLLSHWSLLISQVVSSIYFYNSVWDGVQFPLGYLQVWVVYRNVGIIAVAMLLKKVSFPSLSTINYKEFRTISCLANMIYFRRNNSNTSSEAFLHLTYSLPFSWREVLSS